MNELRFWTNELLSFLSYLTSARNIGLIVAGVLLWREFRKGKRPA
jgi:hypothetical protein